jgi:cytochrome bd-type quinol oxidase subunit 2
MKSSLVRFLVAVAVFVAGCLWVQQYINGHAAEDLKLKTGYALLGFVTGCVVLFHLFLVLGNDGKPAAFVRKFLLVATLKFFIYIIAIVLFFFLASENPRALIAHFLLYYTGFTAIEVFFLYREMK